MDGNIVAAGIGAAVAVAGWLASKLVESGKLVQGHANLAGRLTAQDAKMEKQDAKLDTIERLTRENRDAVQKQNGSVAVVMERTIQHEKRLESLETVASKRRR